MSGWGIVDVMLLLGKILLNDSPFVLVRRGDGGMFLPSSPVSSTELVFSSVTLRS